MKTHDDLLGWTVRDKITGFQGVVTGYIYYMTGCNQCLVLPPIDKDGKQRELAWFDVQRLEFVSDTPRIVLENSYTPGFFTPPRPEH